MNTKAKQTEEDLRILKQDIEKEDLNTLPRWLANISRRFERHNGCPRFDAVDEALIASMKDHARVDFCTVDGARAISINGKIAKVAEFRLLREWMEDGNVVKFEPGPVEVGS